MDQLFSPDDGDPPRTRTAVPLDEAPLAVRMRPRTVGELVGQEHLLHEGAPLRKAIEEGQPHSMILYGPPGSGKTTLARIVASSARAAFEELSAVEAGRAEVRQVLERAEHRRKSTGERTVFFLDEIHRFNKAQQDALLPAVEEGLVTLIGATTENPYFEVNSALISRSRIYELRALGPDEIRALLRRALDRGECSVAVASDALDFLAARSDGDARTALSALELACASSDGEEVTLEQAEQALQRKALHFDRAGDQHYDYVSAWIKATRGSDPDASLYYLAVMIEGGEDPRFIARRMVILASEDVGNADPQALLVAVAAAHAVEHVGMPEAAHALAQAAVYLSLAPKSNAAYAALKRARGHVREFGAAKPPPELLSAAYGAAKTLGRGVGYDYPHDRPGAVSPQELMPDEVAGTRFYEPGENERAMAERLAAIRRARGREG
ncbi:MAG TPA: replication-associated recombination protein A [Solirubrobacteraceae bacterium]|jgi:putative ATPase|nr:replication-associated recombination protein A [Solirubrobacteraceae bacterium]